MERFPELAFKGFPEDLAQIVNFVPPDRGGARFDLGKQRSRAALESALSQLGGKILLCPAVENAVFPDAGTQKLLPPVPLVHREFLRCLLGISSKPFASPPASLCGKRFLGNAR